MVETHCAYLRKSRKDMEAEARGEGETLSRHRKYAMCPLRALCSQLSSR